jgi:hypothetical protein
VNAQERVAVLEGLLARVRRKAAEPRVVATAAAPVEPIEVVTPVAPPVAAAPTAPAPVALAPTPVDQSIDDLLEAPIPLIQTAPSDRPSVQPISLRSGAEPPIAPPEFGARIEAEEAPIPIVTSAAAPPHVEEEFGAEELGEDDLISVPPPRASEAPAPEITATAAEDVDLDFDEEEEDEMPASSKRPISTPSLQALSEREVPLKTPPPESGPQEALPPAAAFEAPRLPEIRETFGTDISARAEVGPTPEQLGDTIDLPEPSRAALELDVAASPVSPIDIEPPPVSEELEVTLPRRESVGVYDAGLTPPAGARDELRRYEEQAAPVEPAAPMEASGIVSRPELSGVVVSRFSAAARTFAPRSFVELLDASLGLGSD